MAQTEVNIFIPQSQDLSVEHFTKLKLVCELSDQDFKKMRDMNSRPGYSGTRIKLKEGKAESSPFIGSIDHFNGLYEKRGPVIIVDLQGIQKM
jgi:hypothetical protein